MENSRQLVNDLRALIGTKAETSYNKYVLLEQRDKILRKLRPRMNDVEHATVTVGTCPDMCPEKERYEREVQKRLSSYEIVQINGESTIDHKRSVKDYGRSAADQEEPLPHELRPATVLDRTMNYLLSEILAKEPKEEQPLAIWYDFLWKRTRAIRKDITQQMLDGELVIGLVEKCARFHIYAAHRLCELDIGSFDQRMNTENLTKCLQTLKHMYEDMSKKSIICVNEAEFRAYDVLLSLNDTDVLRQILTYRTTVRQSPPIRFALKLFSALQNNNYVSFFRLVRTGATFLQSCILHRYFEAVRTRALQTLVRSYGGNCQFPVTELERMLGFENQTAAMNFCSLYGLTVVGDTISFTRGQPLAVLESAPDMKRSTLLVDSKRRGALSEILNGGPMSLIRFSPPTVSFDEQHRYVNDTVIKEFLDDSNGGPHTEDRHVQEPTLSRQELGHVANSLLNDVIDTSIRKTAGNMVVSIKSEHVFNSLLVRHLRYVAEMVLNEEIKRVVLIKQQKIQEQNLQKAMIQGSTDRVLEETLVSLLKELAAEEYEDAKDQIKSQVLAEARIINKNFLADIITQEIERISRSFYRSEVEATLKSLKSIRGNLQSILIRRYFYRWLSFARSNVYRRRLLNSFPACPLVPSFLDGTGEQNGNEQWRETLKSDQVGCISPRSLEAKNYIMKQTPALLAKIVASELETLAAEEIRETKWRSRIEKRNVSLISMGSDHSRSSLNGEEITNKRRRLLEDFPCHPSSEASSSPTASTSVSDLRICQESPYSWMDQVKRMRNEAQQHRKCVEAAAAAKQQRTPSKSSPDGFSFRAIPLTSSERLFLQTMETLRRVRAEAETEAQLGKAQLEEWMAKISHTSSS